MRFTTATDATSGRNSGEYTMAGSPGRVRARGGDDTAITSDGEDRIHGGKGAGFIIDGAGRDKSSGGAGGDAFHLSDLAGRGHAVVDFQNGEDRVFVDMDGVDVSDVSLRRRKGGVEISIDGHDHRLLLEDVRLGRNNARDFGFSDGIG